MKSIFELAKRDGGSGARAGILKTAHGDVPTPVFMPVGTQGTVKTLSSEEVAGLGYGVILGNTYHLYLRPGLEVLERCGGLHKFMNWEKAILTDSGGFQIFSLGDRIRLREEGVSFSSHVDGARHELSPEQVVDVQKRMGVDIAMCLDECPPYPIEESVARESLERTLRWAARCRAEWLKNPDTPDRTLLFPIVQGGMYPALRRESARRTVELDFPGHAVGGLSVGEPRDLMLSMLEESVAELPEEKPRYLMGVGDPVDMLEAVARGVDMFDCVLPTRNGRNGQALTWRGPLNLRNAQNRLDTGPIEDGCACATCQKYSRAYLSHLFRAGEFLAMRLVSLHNLAFMIDFVRRMRNSIEKDRFGAFQKEFLASYRKKSEAV